MNSIWLLRFLEVVGHRYVTRPEVPIHRGAQMLNLSFLHSESEISQVSVADSKGKRAAVRLKTCHVLHLLTLYYPRHYVVVKQACGAD